MLPLRAPRLEVLEVLAQGLRVTPNYRDALVRDVLHEVHEWDAGDLCPAPERHAFATVEGCREGETYSRLTEQALIVEVEQQCLWLVAVHDNHRCLARHAQSIRGIVLELADVNAFHDVPT